MKSIKNMNANSLEKSKMEMVKGGANGQSDTYTVTYYTSLGCSEVSGDGADTLVGDVANPGSLSGS